jgi:hypothetical protein
MPGLDGIQTVVLPHLGGFFRNPPVVCLALLQVAHASGMDDQWIDRLVDLAKTEGPRLWPFMPWGAATGMNKSTRAQCKSDDLI